jgi:hypothetical protein
MKITDTLFGTIEVEPHDIELIVKFKNNEKEIKKIKVSWEKIKGYGELGLTDMAHQAYLKIMFDTYKTEEQKNDNKIYAKRKI